MSFSKITIIESTLALLATENIDTDQIIPARFLKTTSREGFGKNLFYDWRYNSTGELNYDFELNKNKNNCTILVAGRNFGCGSSREHAAWAIYDYGFKVVVSSFFADIFRNNALNNGILPVQVSEQFLQKIFQYESLYGEVKLKIDLSNRSVTISKTGEFEFFEINTYKQNCLINGFDDIDYLTTHIEEIINFEQNKV